LAAKAKIFRVAETEEIGYLARNVRHAEATCQRTIAGHLFRKIERRVDKTGVEEVPWR